MKRYRVQLRWTQECDGKFREVVLIGREDIFADDAEEARLTFCQLEGVEPIGNPHYYFSMAPTGVFQ